MFSGRKFCLGILDYLSRNPVFSENFPFCKTKIGRHCGLMISALDSGSSGLGSGPGRGRCVEFFGKKLSLLSRCLSPPRCISNGLASHPGGVEILQVASCYRNRR